MVGHDIGAMVAMAYALLYRDDVRALCFGEAPVPGTSGYEQMKTAPSMWHVASHTQLDLPESLTADREEVYLQHFYDRLGLRPSAVDTEHYARAFADVTTTVVDELAVGGVVRPVADTGHRLAEENPHTQVHELVTFDPDG